MDAGGPAPGTEVGGYRIVAPLGSGGMGTVYRAVDGGGSVVALKLLHPHVGADPAARDRLRREVAALQRLRHPGVAAVLDAETDSAEAFVVTELVDGLTLEEQVRRGGPLPPLELAELAAGLCDALDAVHAAGVVHRDLKPGNVMVTGRGPVLIDFGIAQAAEDTRVTSAGFVVGTPGYLAPELLADGDPSAASDWWGWAAVLAFAASGRPPFGTRPLDAVIARTRAGDVDLAGVPYPLAAPLRAALEPDPALRATPDDVVADLARVAGSVPPPPPTQVLLADRWGDDAGAPGTAPTRAVPPVGAGLTRVVPVVPGPATAPTGVLGAAGAAAGAGAGAGVVGAGDAVVPVAQDGMTRALPAVGTGGATAVRVPGADGGYPGGGYSGGGYPGGGHPGGGYPGGGYPGGPAVDGPSLDEPYGYGDAPAADSSAGHPYGPAPGAGGGAHAAVAWVPPRPGRRAGTVLALGLATVAGASLYPGVTLLLVAFGLLLFRTVGSAAEARDRRRERRGGPRRGDSAHAAATSPWHLVRGLVGLLPSLLIAASVVVVVGGVLWWALQTGRLVVPAAGPAPDGANGPLAFSGALALAVGLGVLAAWFGPLARLTRVGARRVVGALAPGWSGAAVLVTLALGITGVLVVLLATGQPVTWWPLPGPPSVR